MDCQTCGEPLPPGAPICQNCGAPVDSQPLEDGSLETAALLPAVPTEMYEKIGLEAIKGSVSDQGGELLKKTREGAELYAIVGLGRHGKSEFMASLLFQIIANSGQITHSAIRRFLKQDRGVHQTPGGQYFGWQCIFRGKHILFWDISGEDFKKLADSDQLSADQDLIALFERILPQCKGLVLTVSLRKLWDHWNKADGTSLDPVKRRANLERNLDAYLGFLRLTANLCEKRRVRRFLRRSQESRISIPVFVNLSMADTYDGIHTPQAPEIRDSGRPGLVKSRLLRIREDDPLIISYLYLQPIYRFLFDEFRWFKFDYSHAFQTGQLDEQRPEIRDPLGCLEALQFLQTVSWSTLAGSTADCIRYDRSIGRRTVWESHFNRSFNGA